VKLRKSVLIISLVVLVALVVAGIYFLGPRKVIDIASDFSLTRVLYKGEDITNLIDEKEIADLLNNYDCKRTFKNYFPYQTTDAVVEIDGRINQKPVHILLGKFFISYESADKGAYEIIDGNKLLDEMTIKLDKVIKN